MKRARAGWLALLVPRLLFAQIEAPHPKEQNPPGYPDGAHGEAVVLLELFVAADGAVTEVRVIAGADPFLDRAKIAASHFVFEPATRDGKPMAARVRVEIPFHENAPGEIAPPKLVVILPPAPAVLKPITDVEEVHVRGTRNEAGGTTMAKDEVRDMPGAFGDAFRAIDMLPGVVPIISGVPFFFVRGAPPGNTGYFIDGVRVPLLYHIALGPSVVHPSLIERVDFYPGGYPAAFGRFTGGIVNGELRAPATSLTGEANVRLFDAGVLGEAPFANGKGSALVSGRFGYPALLVPLFSPDTQVSYWDYQGRVSYRVTPRDTLSAFLFGSFDEIDTRDRDFENNPGPFYPAFRTQFHRADLRWDHTVTGGNLRTALTLGTDNSLEGSISGNRQVISETLQLRTQLDQRLSPKVRVRAGADVLFYHYDYSGTDTPTANITATLAYPPRNDVIFGAYVDAVWRPHPRVEIVPGLRADVYTSRAVGATSSLPFGIVTGGPATAAVGVDPRLAARITVSKRLTWVATFGVTHQPPSFIVPVPGGELGSLANGLQSAIQASQGFEAELPWALSLKSTFFIHDYFNISNAIETCFDRVSPSFPDTSCLDARTRGRSFGLELLLRRSFSKRIAGWISYTLSRSTVEFPTGFAGQGIELLSSFDRTHVFNSAFAFDFGRGWRAGTRFTYYTGLPQTAAPTAPRLPDFWRIDLRLEKKWRVGKHSSVAAVLEGMNITFNKEAIGTNCSFPQDSSPPKCKTQYIGPVSVPSLGVEVVY